MDNKPVIAAGVLLILCLICIAVQLFQHTEIPGFLLAFTGVVCGFLLKCLYDNHKSQQQKK